MRNRKFARPDQGEDMDCGEGEIMINLTKGRNLHKVQ